MAEKFVKAWATFEDFNHDLEINPNSINRGSSRLEYMNERLIAEENSLKNLVGKSDEEELDIDDARTIGKKISKMHGDDRKKFIGIVNFMGASCRIYNEIWANYKPVDPKKKKSNKGKEFRGDKEIG